MRTLITGFQTGGKICSNLGPQRQSADPSITHGPSLSCPEHSSVGRRLNWTWPQHFPTQRQCPTLRSWRHYQLMPRSSAGGARRPRSARRDSFASLHAKGRKRKTINPPWEHAEDMNLPGSADCQPKPPRACSILPLSSWPFPLPLLEGKGSSWGAGCRTRKGTMMGYSENVSSWWQQSRGLRNVNQISRRKCHLRSLQDAIFSRVPSHAAPSAPRRGQQPECPARNLLWMQVLEARLRLTTLETLGREGNEEPHFDQPSRWPRSTLKLRNHKHE